MIFIKRILEFNRPLKSYMIVLKYGWAGRNVILELYDTESDSSYTVGLNDLIVKYYSKMTVFGEDDVLNYHKLKGDMPIYGFNVINGNELSFFTCSNLLKSELYDKFDFKITELSQESPAQAIEVGGVDTDTGVLEKSHHVLTLFVDLYANDKFLILPTENGYHYYIKNTGHYFDVEITQKVKSGIDRVITKLITLTNIKDYFQG